MSNEMALELDQAFIGEDSSAIEKTFDNIAERLAYRHSVEELMQMAIISKNDRERLAILYAINSLPLLRSSTLENYIKASLALSISVKGTGREQVLEIGKASTQHATLGMLAKIRSKVGFD